MKVLVAAPQKQRLATTESQIQKRPNHTTHQSTTSSLTRTGKTTPKKRLLSVSSVRTGNFVLLSLRIFESHQGKSPKFDTHSRVERKTLGTCLLLLFWSNRSFLRFHIERNYNKEALGITREREKDFDCAV
jgi:hypothetical protein